MSSRTIVACGLGVVFQQPARRFEGTYQLFEELHRKYHAPFLEHLAKNVKNGLGTETREENYRRIFGSGPDCF